MNTNFFNQRKSLRAFQTGGSMPQREQFNSEPKYDAAMESYLNSAGTPSVASSFVGPQDNSTQNVTPPIVVSQNQSQTPAPAETQAIPGYQGASIVDFLKSMGVDSSKVNRRKLANLSGNDNYNMSGDENAALMDYVRKNMQGKDKVRNIDGNIVALDGSRQVPMTIDGLDHMTRTGSLPVAKKQKGVSGPMVGSPEYNADWNKYSTNNSGPNVGTKDYNDSWSKYANKSQNNNIPEGINFLNKNLNFGDSSQDEIIPNYDRDNKDNLGFLDSLGKGTTDQIDFDALHNIAKAIKNNSGKVITSNGRKVEYSSLSNSEKEKLQSELGKYKRDSYTF